MAQEQYDEVNGIFFPMVKSYSPSPPCAELFDDRTNDVEECVRATFQGRLALQPCSAWKSNEKTKYLNQIDESWLPSIITMNLQQQFTGTPEFSCLWNYRIHEWNRLDDESECCE